MLALWSGAAAAQDAPPKPPPAPGLFGAVGKWVDDTLSDVNSGFGNARGTLDSAAGQAGDTAKDAAAAAANVARIPLATTVVAGRQRCIAAPNQAPDCQAATDALCRDKGFKTGRSLDVQSAQKCPAQVWISGHASEGQCTMETYVTRAVCQ